MCHVEQILSRGINKCVTTKWWSPAIRKAFEWRLAINTSLSVDIQQTPEASISLLCNTLRCVCLHMPPHVPLLSQGRRISDAELERLWHSRVKAIVGEKSTSRRPFRHVWRTVQSCSFGWSPWQPWDVKAAQGNGCSGGSVDRALPFLAMVTVTGGEYIVIFAQSQLHSQ